VQKRRLGNTDLELTSVGLGTRARRPSQICETAPAGDWKLSKEDINKIEELLAARNAKLDSKTK